MGWWQKRIKDRTYTLFKLECYTVFKIEKERYTNAYLVAWISTWFFYHSSFALSNELPEPSNAHLDVESIKYSRPSTLTWSDCHWTTPCIHYDRRRRLETRMVDQLGGSQRGMFSMSTTAMKSFHCWEAGILIRTMPSNRPRKLSVSLFYLDSNAEILKSTCKIHLMQRNNIDPFRTSFDFISSLQWTSLQSFQ